MLDTQKPFQIIAGIWLEMKQSHLLANVEQQQMYFSQGFLLLVVKSWSNSQGVEAVDSIAGRRGDLGSVWEVKVPKRNREGGVRHLGGK